MRNGNAFEGFVSIYTLSDVCGNVFYVGCTVQKIAARLRCHLCDASGPGGINNRRKAAKILSIDKQVTANVIEEIWVKSKNAYEAVFACDKREQYWIKKYIESGCILYNKEFINKKLTA